MSLSDLKRTILFDDGIQSVNHKGWDVMVRFNGDYYEVTICRMLDENSDAAHGILSNSRCDTLCEVKEEVRIEVDGYSHTAKEIQTLHDSGRDMNNLDTLTTASELLAA